MALRLLCATALLATALASLAGPDGPPQLATSRRLDSVASPERTRAFLGQLGETGMAGRVGMPKNVSVVLMNYKRPAYVAKILRKYVEVRAAGQHRERGPSAWHMRAVDHHEPFSWHGSRVCRAAIGSVVGGRALGGACTRLWGPVHGRTGRPSASSVSRHGD
jgi:hypothetical protein